MRESPTPAPRPASFSPVKLSLETLQFYFKNLSPSGPRGKICYLWGRSRSQSLFFFFWPGNRSSPTEITLGFTVGVHVLDPPTCDVTHGLFPHLNNEVIFVVQGFSTPAADISSARQDGVTDIGFTFPPEVTKKQNSETTVFKTLDIGQRRGEERGETNEGSPITAVASSPGRVARSWSREEGPRWNPGGPRVEAVELRFQKTTVAGVGRTQCQEESGTERELSGECAEVTCLGCGENLALD